MALTQAHRIQLHDIMKDKLGTTGAELLLEALPPMDATTLATKTDVDNVRIELRGQISELRGEMATEFAAVRGEIYNVRNDMTTEFAAVRGEMATGFATVQMQMAKQSAETTQLRADLTASSRHILLAVIVAIISIGLSYKYPGALG